MTFVSPHIDFFRANLEKPVVIVGLMGAGKTTIGQLMADALNLDFIDSDHRLEEKEGRSISQIFDQEGEDYFRQAEKQNILEILDYQIPCILATGGGAFMNLETRKEILKSALSVFLKADLGVLVKRIGSGKGRPLFNDRKLEDVLAELIAARYPTYSNATLTIDVADEAAEETASNVINSLYKYLSPA